MNPFSTVSIVFLLAVILLSLFIAFVYLWLYIAKKQDLYKKLEENKRGNQKHDKSLDRMVRPLIKAAEKAGPTALKYPFFATPQKDEMMLAQAGKPFGLSLQGFYGLRFVLGLSSLFLFTLYTFLGLPLGLMLLILMPLLAFFSPNLWLLYKAKERQEQISAAMPDFLDTVSVTLQAGVGLDPALRQVARQLEGPLAEEIEQFNREIDLGVPRRTAYDNLLSKNTSKELETLVQSLIQGSTLGVPVSSTFQIQASDLRSTRGFKAREKAAKASPQITLVTTFFVAPAVFMLIIGLLFLNVIYNPGAFGLDVLFE